MNHELVKQLKDAEFPLVEVPLDPLVRGRWEVAHRIDGVDYFDPTLAELIAACGYEGFVMWELDGKFYAAKKADGCRGESYYDDYPVPEQGGTLEEAVARLWLALNQTND